MSYEDEKFYDAIQSLSGSGTRRERLINAYAESLTHLNADNLPEEIRLEFIQFTEDITRIPAEGDEGSVAATVNSSTDVEIDKLVDRVIDMYETVTRHQDPD